ncbi:transglutaminase-like cysteine peptidase [Microvirga lotononidis]|uniref:Putative periplasmic protein n=1 Tax=Microvirga lotononidis TaxID=864069 RepID=I4YKW5_9HYPH|nr:transglutaminase-like cysteine peptidase [Microvirga lotononidis]EIM24607.1 putative periplasmic protein [Microvirga lotononidis]WQO26622.1 transglutaminase-like cysteine peptidase [Microvirga lotononidis]
MGRRTWIVLAWFLSAASSVNAGPHLFRHDEAPPLPAWVEFCHRNPDECTIDLRQPEMIPLTDGLSALLSSVNVSVNRSLIPVTDQDHWGVVDLWSYPTDGMGDCEDYQLLKRKMLVEAGLPRRALRMTVVLDENGEGHAVLTVRTNRGDLILDNKTDNVLEWSRTNYRYIKRESAEATGWVYLTPDPAGTSLTASSGQ